MVDLMVDNAGAPPPLPLSRILSSRSMEFFAKSNDLRILNIGLKDALSCKRSSTISTEAASGFHTVRSSIPTYRSDILSSELHHSEQPSGIDIDRSYRFYKLETPDLCAKIPNLSNQTCNDEKIIPEQIVYNVYPTETTSLQEIHNSQPPFMEKSTAFDKQAVEAIEKLGWGAFYHQDEKCFDVLTQTEASITQYAQDYPVPPHIVQKFPNYKNFPLLCSKIQQPKEKMPTFQPVKTGRVIKSYAETLTENLWGWKKNNVFDDHIHFMYVPNFGRVQALTLENSDGSVFPLVTLPKMTPNDIIKYLDKKRLKRKQNSWRNIFKKKCFCGLV